MLLLSWGLEREGMGGRMPDEAGEVCQGQTRKQRMPDENGQFLKGPLKDFKREMTWLHLGSKKTELAALWRRD